MNRLTLPFLVVVVIFLFQQCGSNDASDKFIGKWITPEHLATPETNFIQIGDENYDRILEITFSLNSTLEKANGSYEISCDCILTSNKNLLYFDNDLDQIVFQDVNFVREDMLEMEL